MVDTTNVKGDIRIEPFMKNESNMYFQSILESKEIVPLDSVKEIIQSMVTLATTKSLEASQNLFN